MSLKETYTLAHTAQCKLRLAVERPDRDLRFMVGHAMHLDSLMLRIVEIEESVEQSQHASGVKFKGTGVRSGSHLSSKSPAVRKSPPPRSAESESDSDDDERDEDGLDGGDEEDDLSLTRFPSGAAAPPRYPEDAPQLISSEDDSDSSDEDYTDLLARDPDSLRDLISNKTEGDEFLADLYNDIKKCPCHKSDAPSIERMWELPREGNGARTAVVEVSA